MPEIPDHSSVERSSATDEDVLSFVAPCRQLTPLAPLKWLQLGWRDLIAAPLQSIFYGVLLTAVSVFIALATWRFGTLALYLGLATGFVFVGPVLATGLYSISAQLEKGGKPTLRFGLRAARSHVREVLVLGVCLLVVLLVWARAATLMNVFRSSQAKESLRDLLPYLGIGSVVGAVFASIVFAATAFSLPMLLDRRADAVTAVVTSINATLRNKLTLFVWGMLIVIAVLIGFATAFIGFVVLLPVIGHATWHAYRATINASAWPTHL